MKNLLFICAFLLVSSAAFSQSIPKGALMGIHSFEVKLKDNVSEQQYLSEFKSKWIPVASKAYEAEIHVLNFARGESKNKVGLLFFYKNAAKRDKFYSADGSLNDTGKAAYAAVKVIDDQLAKLGTTSGSYIDWIVD
jgi:hypothetical protein